MSELVTVVTGSRKGIGRAVAAHYAGAGHRVIGVSRTAPDDADAQHEHELADVADEQAVTQLFANIRKRHGRIDHLVNCAGIASMNHSLLTPGSTFRRLLETNVLGTFLCSREAAKVMQKRKFGRIVNFGSVAVPLKLEGEAAYAASKAAVVTLSEVMARELAAFGITVNVIGPSVVDTDLTANVPPDRIDALLQRQAIHRKSTMDDVLAAIDFFLAPASSAITGQTLYLGGP